MPDLPTIGNIEPAVLALLGAWLFAGIQFGKGKLWADKWTTAVALGLPFLVAAVLVWGGEQATQFLQVVAVLSMLATGAWAVTKVAKDSGNV